MNLSTRIKEFMRIEQKYCYLKDDYTSVLMVKGFSKLTKLLDKPDDGFSDDMDTTAIPM
jgi:hypothetical protein